MADVMNDHDPHAGGTGAHGKGARVPGEEHAGGTGTHGKGACVPTGEPSNGGEEISSPHHLTFSPSSYRDPLGRAPGEALCPARFNVEALHRLRRKLGTYSFAALYQQRPVPADGGLFKRAWFKIVPVAPPNLRWKRGYDTAVSRNPDADYTASFRVAYDKAGNMYIDGGFRKRMEYPELRRYILGRIATERDTEHGVELSANGNAIIQDLRTDPSVRGRAFRGIKVVDNKISRALPWIAMAEEGRVYLVRGGWNTEFIDEACAFPAGTHDDQIDAVSIAVRMCTMQKNRGYGFVIW